jgi:bisphosphoglycerate-independent phosphoglycerate mutase (AlkP superfamily)
LVLVAVESTSSAELPLGGLAGGASTFRLQLSQHERISAEAIANNPVLRTQLRKTKERGGRMHLIGMLSEGSGHAAFSHLLASIGAAERAGVRVVVHAILDGLDASQRAAAGVLAQLEARLSDGVGRIGTVSGRAWTVDAEGRWERIEKLFRALMADGVTRFDSAIAGVKEACQFGKPEGFTAPFVVFDYPGVSLVDSAVHVHASPLGARALTRALCAPSFEPFLRGPGQAPFQGRFTSMVPYDAALSLPTLFPRAADPATLPWEWVAKGDRKLWRCAPGSLREMTDATVHKLSESGWDCALVDLASPALKELYVQQPPQALSGALGVIADAALSADAALLVVGSANADGFVPCARLSKRSLTLRAEGAWDDLAPTLIELLALPADPEVEGASLLC